MATEAKRAKYSRITNVRLRVTMNKVTPITTSAQTKVPQDPPQLPPVSW